MKYESGRMKTNASDCLVEPSHTDTIEFCQIRIQHHLMSSKEKD